MAALLRYLRSPLRMARVLRNAPAMSYATDPSKLPTDEEQATGLERKELMAHLEGNEDPFKFNIKPTELGTKEKPTEIRSMYEERIVGCICDEDSRQIVWMNLTSGSPQRCDCGHYFQLVKGNPIDIDMSTK